jgi:hypothetical protein
MDRNRLDVRQSDAAVQYLIWAVEEIEKLGGHARAAFYAHIALDELSGLNPAMPNRRAEEAKRFRDKADEAEQLAELAETASRRDALRTIVESYRRTAEQMDRLSAER